MKALHVTQFVVVILIAGIVGVQMVGALTSPETQEYVNESAEWCEKHGGELVNVRAFWHGGLHCDLPNGTSVHMSRVIDDD